MIVRSSLLTTWFAIAAAAVLAGLPSHAIASEPLSPRIQERHERLFPHQVWTHHWATFSERSRVAARLNYSVEQFDGLVKQHGWLLQSPPALKPPDDALRRAAPFGSGRKTRLAVTDFVADEEGTIPAVETRVEVLADDAELRLEFRCAEAAANPLLNRASHSTDDFHRLVLDGDVHKLYQLQRGIQTQTLLERIAAVPPRELSVYEDDCLFVRLTPVSQGEDLSREFRVRDQRDPAALLRQLGPAPRGDLHLEGSFYTIAVNAAGVVHSSFYDPYEGGRYWCCWSPNARVDCRRQGDAWYVSIAAAWEHFHPLLSRGAVWGLDIYRHRPARGGRPEQLARTRDTIFLSFDGDGRQIERRLAASGIDEASLGKWSRMWEREDIPAPEGGVVSLDAELERGEWPTDAQWRKAARLAPLRDHRSGAISDVKTEVRLLQTREELLVRFDCQEPDRRPLRVVTREDEIASRGANNRGVNWLDRRESFDGPDWGDHVEIQLAPSLGGTDPFHNGYYLILVNSHGDVLSRYFDPCGAYSVDVESWSLRARSQTKIHSGRWTIQVAAPWRSFFGLEAAGTTWYANFLRHRPGPGGGQTHAWAVPYGATREPGGFGRLSLAESPLPNRGDPRVPRFWPGRPDDAGAPTAAADRTGDCLTSVELVGGDRVVAVGSRGTTWRSSVGRNDWQCACAGTQFNLQRVQFVDRERGWAVGGWSRDKRVALCGGMGIILSTNDGGYTWKPSWRAKGAWFYDLCFVNPQIGYVCGGYGTVMKTTDGGHTWQGPLSTSTNSWLYGIDFVDENHGWVVGAHETLLHTGDGGQTWQRQTADGWRRPRDLRERLWSVDFVDSSHGWAVGERGTILRTTDGGDHWTQQKLPIADELVDLLELRDVCFIDREAGWIVGLLGSVVLRTDDGGRSWNLCRTGFRGGLHAVKAADRQRVWAVGERGARLASSDGGRTWSVDAATSRPAWVFITPHDHHLNAWAGLIAATADDVDWVTARCGRGAFYFEPYLDYYHQRWTAGAQSAGSVIIREWNDLLNSRRRQPQYVHHAYQLYGGTRPLVLRLTALFRLTRPEAIFTEWPVFAEGYWAWETALAARCAREAYFVSGDSEQFSELSELGLDAWQPAELYTSAEWYNQAFGLRPGTHVLIPRDGNSLRLGGTRLEAVRRSAACWEGLMDRATAAPRGWMARRQVHLVHRARNHEGLSRTGLEIETREFPSN